MNENKNLIEYVGVSLLIGYLGIFIVVLLTNWILDYYEWAPFKIKFMIVFGSLFSAFVFVAIRSHAQLKN